MPGYLGDNGREMEGNLIYSGRTLGKCKGERTEFDWVGSCVCASLSWGL